MANATIKTYAGIDTPSEEIPVGMERISLVQDDNSGDILYQVEDARGGCYVCDAAADKVTLGGWTLLRVLADVPADDADAFFSAVAATAKAEYTLLFEAGEGEGYWTIEEDAAGMLCVTSNAETRRPIDLDRHRGMRSEDAEVLRAEFREVGMPDDLIERYFGQAGL